MSQLLFRSRKASASVFVLIFALGLLVGGLASFYINYKQISNLNSQVDDLTSKVGSLQGQISTIQNNGTIQNQTIIISQNGTDLAEINNMVRDSVVLVQSVTDTGDVQGSGFIYNYNGEMLVVTNFHVVYETTSLSVTFANGNGYAATVLGTDPYADLAVVSVEAPAGEFHPVDIVSSSSLQVGDQVIAIGNPYGLVGSLTTGVVSALGRTIQESVIPSSFSIANVIQTSTPINPGNSGGPLLNAVGKVVGITTAIVSDSQGLGFAIPSETILREIGVLANGETYNGHSYLGIFLTNMNYQLSQEINSDVTYGVLVTAGSGQDAVVPDGPSGGILQSQDIIISLNGTRIRNSDDLASYLASETLPNDTVRVGIERDNQQMTVNVVLGTRPPPNI